MNKECEPVRPRSGLTRGEGACRLRAQDPAPITWALRASVREKGGRHRTGGPGGRSEIKVK